MFEWDPKKNITNIAKHGFGFETAIRIFEGWVLTAIDDRFDYGEIRENSIGMVDGLVFILVTHTDRADRKRIISARPATRRERERYDKALRARAESGRTE